jgi:putative spermidine/putrescine transport system ATP-binding protein
VTPPPPHPLVRFSKVAKSYDGRTLVVRDLDLDIARGEFLTLLGPSGSGKTTTLMMLAGFEAPTAGSILLDGNDITRLPPHRRGIGVVFQNYALFPHMGVAENVAYPLAVRGVPKAEAKRKVEAALDMVKLAGFGDRRPAQLSGGQQQRVALARALVFEPDLILLDEPLGALDKQLRERMQYELKQLHERLGKTMVYVTHDQSEALTMSDRIAVFDEGEVRQLAPPAELYERPATLFVAEFVGESNRLDGIVVSCDATGARVRLDDGAEIVAAPAAGLRAGLRVAASVRPERLGFAPRGTPNALPARVERIVFHGDALRVILRRPGGGELIVKLPSTGAPPPVARDAEVAATFAPSDCRVFPVEGA